MELRWYKVTVPFDENRDNILKVIKDIFDKSQTPILKDKFKVTIYVEDICHQTTGKLISQNFYLPGVSSLDTAVAVSETNAQECNKPDKQAVTKFHGTADLL